MKPLKQQHFQNLEKGPLSINLKDVISKIEELKELGEKQKITLKKPEQQQNDKSKKKIEIKVDPQEKALNIERMKRRTEEYKELLKLQAYFLELKNQGESIGKRNSKFVEEISKQIADVIDTKSLNFDNIKRNNLLATLKSAENKLEAISKKIEKSKTLQVESKDILATDISSPSNTVENKVVQAEQVQVKPDNVKNADKEIKPKIKVDVRIGDESRSSAASLPSSLNTGRNENNASRPRVENFSRTEKAVILLRLVQLYYFANKQFGPEAVLPNLLLSGGRMHVSITVGAKKTSLFQKNIDALHETLRQKNEPDEDTERARITSIQVH